jgi:hypothetical protein
MGFRFRRSIRVLPGVRLNVSKSGVSTSIGSRGAWLTFGRKGTRATLGIPGTGLGYTTTTARRVQSTPPPETPSAKPARTMAWLFWFVVPVLAIQVLVHWLDTH